jgi:hypothetical protein
MQTGRFDDGLGALTEALAAADEREIRYYEAEIHRLKGELLLRQDESDTAEAKRSFERAIEIARAQSAKSWELRDDEPRTAARKTGPPRRSLHNACRYLQLVHRGLRHRRPHRRQGSARSSRGLKCAGEGASYFFLGHAQSSVSKRTRTPFDSGFFSLPPRRKKGGAPPPFDLSEGPESIDRDGSGSTAANGAAAFCGRGARISPYRLQGPLHEANLVGTRR